jgi:hypothetical protein
MCVVFCGAMRQATRLWADYCMKIGDAKKVEESEDRLLKFAQTRAGLTKGSVINFHGS